MCIRLHHTEGVRISLAGLLWQNFSLSLVELDSAKPFVTQLFAQRSDENNTKLAVYSATIAGVLLE